MFFLDITYIEPIAVSSNISSKPGVPLSLSLLPVQGVVLADSTVTSSQLPATP